MNSIKSAKTKSTIPAKHQLNNGEILHHARRFESLPVLAVVRFNTGTFLTPPRQEQFISCIWYLVVFVSFIICRLSELLLEE